VYIRYPGAFKAESYFIASYFNSKHASRHIHHVLSQTTHCSTDSPAIVFPTINPLRGRPGFTHSTHIQSDVKGTSC
jgi:hypothetical protein